MNRKIIFNHPPASSPWHLPAGIAYLTAILQQDGHEVLQRYSHITGLEYVLREQAPSIQSAFDAIRNPASDILDLYEARMQLEQTSRNIKTPDKFVVERNNVLYVSSYYDGSVEGVLQAVDQRSSSLWGSYFSEVEVPLAQDFQPGIYGISISDERQLIPGCVLASMIKDFLPNTLVILGGNFWSRVEEAFSHPEFVKFFEFCDGIVYAEGFQPIRDLALGVPLESVGGLVHLVQGRVKINPIHETASAFEELPTPVYNGDARTWSPDDVIPLYTMSNCPYKCRFCGISRGSDTFLDKPRFMTPARIAYHMMKTGASRFDITDETLSVQRQLALGNELRCLGYSATWQCYTTVNPDLADPATCEKLYLAGCRAVQLGLESLSDETLGRENKKWNTPNNYGVMLKNLRDAGIQTHVFLIAGLPDEPLHCGLKWLDFMAEHGRNMLTIKASRYRVTRDSPEDRDIESMGSLEVTSNTKPLHLNRDFKYTRLSMQRVNAVRDLLEQGCIRHWAYGVTSTLPWWTNRGRYGWDDLEQMAKILPLSPDVPHLKLALTKARSIIEQELDQRVKLFTFDSLVEFTRTIM